MNYQGTQLNENRFLSLTLFLLYVRHLIGCLESIHYQIGRLKYLVSPEIMDLLLLHDIL